MEGLEAYIGRHIGIMFRNSRILYGQLEMHPFTDKNGNEDRLYEIVNGYEYGEGDRVGYAETNYFTEIKSLLKKGENEDLSTFQVSIDQIQYVKDLTPKVKGVYKKLNMDFPENQTGQII